MLRIFANFCANSSDFPTQAKNVTMHTGLGVWNKNTCFAKFNINICSKGRGHRKIIHDEGNLGTNPIILLQKVAMILVCFSSRRLAEKPT
jgi:hypothetical protein